MAKNFFDRDPANWQELEAMIALAFAEMGYTAHRANTIETVRGPVEIDVRAVKPSSPIPTVILCECKYWNKPVPQTIVHAFRTVCADAGAHVGLIVSKRGFQAGADKSRVATNIHLMDFAEFQATFFSEWLSGAFMLLARMRDQLLPIFRASSGILENGLDLIDAGAIEGVSPFEKYSVFFGIDGAYSRYFIERVPLPATFNDPRGDPRIVTKVTVRSHREYLDIATAALIECTRRFSLPHLYFDGDGELLPNDI